MRMRKNPTINIVHVARGGPEIGTFLGPISMAHFLGIKFEICSCMGRAGPHSNLGAGLEIEKNKTAR